MTTYRVTIHLQGHVTYEVPAEDEKLARVVAEEKFAQDMGIVSDLTLRADDWEVTESELCRPDVETVASHAAA